MDVESWDLGYLMGMAYREAALSPDPSTQTGALVMDRDGYFLGRGCNEFTRGVEATPERLERPLKYALISHAETNAIYNAFDTWAYGHGRPTVMVATWAACVECAKAIVQSRIRVLVRHKAMSERSHATWDESIALANTILEAGHVRVIEYDGPVENVPMVRFSGELWQPS